MSKKTNKNSFEVADSIELHTLSNFSFSVKTKKKTQVMIQKDRSRKIEILAYWARNYLSISLLGQINDKNLTLELCSLHLKIKRH